MTDGSNTNASDSANAGTSAASDTVRGGLASSKSAADPQSPSKQEPVAKQQPADGAVGSGSGFGPYAERWRAARDVAWRRAGPVLARIAPAIRRSSHAAAEVAGAASRSAAAAARAVAQGAAEGAHQLAGQARRRLPAWMRSETRRKRRRGAVLAIGLAIAGPVLAIATYATLSTSDQAALASPWFKALILADLVYLFALIGLIGAKVARLVSATRARSAGARLHGRMVAVFTGVAAAPTILVAVFFFLIIQLGFQAWFNDQVGSVVRNSREVAQAYAEEHREAIRSQTISLARELAARSSELIDGVRDPRFESLLDRVTENAPFSDVYVIDGSGEIIARSEFSFLFTYTPPSRADVSGAGGGAIVVREDRDRDEMRALVRLGADAYLYVTRPVSGDVLRSVARTNQGVSLYNRLEENRDVWLVQFAALYLGFAALVLLAAIYLGLWFAERLARPIARLAEAAQRVREGDLTARVKEERSEDDLALLSRAFNRMTEEVRRKQEDLTEANRLSEARRQFSEAVVLGVPAGVVGLDGFGRVQVINNAAAEILRLDANAAVGRSFAELAPEFAPLMSDAALDGSELLERQIRLLRDNVELELLARATLQEPSASGAGEAIGPVITIDDLTDLNSAQRLAAWGDVARRVAHEIKNPLTPIQLAAERLRRKYSGRLGDDAESFDRYVETIVRQTGDIGRMVDAFVRFAKLPSPKMAVEPLDAILREAVNLQREGREQIIYDLIIAPHGEARDSDGPAAPDSATNRSGQSADWATRCDRGQITQALTNLLTNAADAIAARLQEEAAAGVAPAPAEIRVSLRRERGRAVIEISDNGVGLPQKERRRLLEPYVTTREKGTGLGLAIVSKILEEHGGSLELADAEPFHPEARAGACARMSTPLLNGADPSIASPATQEVAAERYSDHNTEEAAAADPVEGAAMAETGAAADGLDAPSDRRQPAASLAPTE